LREIAKSDQWENIMGKTPDVDRLDNEEIILRTFALIDKLEEYNGNLAKFLNHYMAEMRSITESELNEKRNTLFSSLSLIDLKIDKHESIHQLGKTLKEGLLVGVANNISTLKNRSKDEFQSMFDNFINDDEFKLNNLRQGLSKKDKVQSRLRKSISIFSA